MGKLVCYKCGMYNGTLQKRVVRLVCGGRHLTITNPLFKQFGILKFVDLVKCKISIIMFKAYHNVLPDSLQFFFLIYMYKYMILAKNVLSVFIVPIPT